MQYEQKCDYTTTIKLGRDLWSSPPAGPWVAPLLTLSPDKEREMIRGDRHLPKAVTRQKKKALKIATLSPATFATHRYLMIVLL